MRLKDITKRSWGVSMQYRIFILNRYTRSWMAYFGIADTSRIFKDLDEWLRRRMRQVNWKQWKRIRTKRKMLISLGIPQDKAYQWACSSKAYWRIAGSAPLQRALPTSYWNDLGLVGLFDAWFRQRAA